MSTTGLVMTVTDELLVELEVAASNATQDAWELFPGTNLSGPEIIANGESIAWVLDSEADAIHIALANPATITALTAELRRLRAENAGLARDVASITEIAAQANVNCRNAAYYLQKYRPDLATICSGWCDAINTSMATQ